MVALQERVLPKPARRERPTGAGTVSACGASLLATGWTYGWPLAAIAVTAAAQGGSRTTWLVAFFTLALLWPATLAVARIFGGRTGAAAGTACAVLLGLQLVVPAPMPRTQPILAERPFEHVHQAARHTIALPAPGERGRATWEQLWRRSPVPEAYVYVRLALRPQTLDSGLGAWLSDRELGALGPDAEVAPPAVPDAGRHQWYRFPVSQADLDRGAPVSITIRPYASPAFQPGSVALLGGHSFRPTYPPAPSAFFDGVSWTTEPHVIFPSVTAPLPTGWTYVPGPMRYVVELRIVESVTRRLLAVYY